MKTYVVTYLIDDLYEHVRVSAMNKREARKEFYAIFGSRHKIVEIEEVYSIEDLIEVLEENE